MRPSDFIDPDVHKPVVNYPKIESLCRELLIAIGEDPDREGLKDTPRRFASWWREFIDYFQGTLDTTFENISTDQMIVTSGIETWSVCEHHLLPFSCSVSIAYIPEDKVLGLSKFARISQRHAHRLQVQERMTQSIADDIVEMTETKNVAVICEGKHLCAIMRGVKTPAVFTTSVMRGVFRDKPEARAEFMKLIAKHI